MDVLDALAVTPTTNGPGDREYSAAQHRGWIANFIYASITPEVRTTLDAHDKFHEDNGPLLFLCLMRKNAGAEMQALALAEAALQPIYLDLKI